VLSTKYEKSSHSYVTDCPAIMVTYLQQFKIFVLMLVCIKSSYIYGESIRYLYMPLGEQLALEEHTKFFWQCYTNIKLIVMAFVLKKAWKHTGTWRSTMLHFTQLMIPHVYLMMNLWTGYFKDCGLPHTNQTFVASFHSAFQSTVYMIPHSL
jgi:hypothetical protein